VLGWLIFKSLNTATEIKTAPMERKVQELADGSRIQLSPNTKIFYQEKNWAEARKIKLEGQAYFEVSKGVPFTVETRSGLIEVLGTAFDIWSAGDYMSVQCFEGSVRVTNAKDGKSVELTVGQQVNLNNSILENVENFEEISPGWIEQNQHIYKGIPIRFVIRDIERFIGKKVKADQLDLDTLFSGLIPFNNAEETARYLAESMGWNYLLSQDVIQFSN